MNILNRPHFFLQAVITSLDVRTNFLVFILFQNANISRNTFNWRQQSTINIVAKRKKITLFSTSYMVVCACFGFWSHECCDLAMSCRHLRFNWNDFRPLLFYHQNYNHHILLHILNEFYRFFVATCLFYF